MPVTSVYFGNIRPTLYFRIHNTGFELYGGSTEKSAVRLEVGCYKVVQKYGPGWPATSIGPGPNLCQSKEHCLAGKAKPSQTALTVGF